MRYNASTLKFVLWLCTHTDVCECPCTHTCVYVACVCVESGSSKVTTSESAITI